MSRYRPGVVNQLSVMSAIIPFKLTDDRRTTITPGYIAIVGRCLGKWISMLVAISLSYLWKWSILMWKTFWVHFYFEENSHDHNYPAFQSYMITESVRDGCETEIDGWPLWPCDPSGQCNDPKTNDQNHTRDHNYTCNCSVIKEGEYETWGGDWCRYALKLTSNTLENGNCGVGCF